MSVHYIIYSIRVLCGIIIVLLSNNISYKLSTLYRQCKELGSLSCFLSPIWTLVVTPFLPALSLALFYLETAWVPSLLGRLSWPKSSLAFFLCPAIIQYTLLNNIKIYCNLVLSISQDFKRKDYASFFPLSITYTVFGTE